MAKSKRYGDVVAELREDKGWTVYRLAKESGMDPTALYRIEAGRQATSADSLLRLCRAMGASLSAFDACEPVEKRPKKTRKKSP